MPLPASNATSSTVRLASALPLSCKVTWSAPASPTVPSDLYCPTVNASASSVASSESMPLPASARIWLVVRAASAAP